MWFHAAKHRFSNLKSRILSLTYDFIMCTSVRAGITHYPPAPTSTIHPTTQQTFQSIFVFIHGPLISPTNTFLPRVHFVCPAATNPPYKLPHILKVLSGGSPSRPTKQGIFRLITWFVGGPRTPPKITSIPFFLL